MSFGERLQLLRQKALLSQDALAEKLEVSRQAVSRWERDETLPETGTVVRLAELFGVTTDYLLRGIDGAAPLPVEKGKGDWMDRLGHLARTKGYLLGYLLILWGVLDLAGVLVIHALSQGMLGMIPSGFSSNEVVDGLVVSFTGFTRAAVWMPVLYGAVKIVGGILAVRCGKRWAEKEKGNEK